MDALDQDLQRMSSEMSASEEYRVSVTTSEGITNEVTAAPGLTLEQMLIGTYNVSDWQAERSCVYMGDDELSLYDTFETNGIEPGARLTVELGVVPGKSKHVVMDNGTWKNRAGFGGYDEEVARMMPQ